MLNSIQREAKDEAASHFRGMTAFTTAERNIVGWGIGTETVDGTIQSDKGTLRVYVRELPGPAMPEQFGDLPTEVIEVGRITAYQSQDPVLCGVSVGHPNVTAGTLGCLVEKDGNHYILSNNHVLADSNAAAPGDPIIQPGTVDGGTSPDNDIATLEPYCEIDFSGEPNAIDAAIALVGDCNQTRVSPEIIGIGFPGSDPVTASFDQIVQKSGRTTGHTIGTVVDISGDFWVNYGDQFAFFEDQIIVESVDSHPFAAGGDSGSLILEKQEQERPPAPVALLFAGSESGIVIANPIKLVLDYYGVTIVGEQGVNA